MKTIALGLALALAGSQARAQGVRLPAPPVPKAAFPMPYDPAIVAGAPEAELQFAILHALMDWEGGASPTYSTYKAADLKVLAAAKVTVKPLATVAERKALRIRLDAVRQAHNDGVKTKATPKPISVEEMIKRHRDILNDYKQHITADGGGSRVSSDTPATKAPLTPAQAKAAYDARFAVVSEMLTAYNALRTAKNDVQLNDSLKAFNAAAAKVPGETYSVVRKTGESYKDVADRALNILMTQGAALKAMNAPKDAKTIALDAEALKATGSFFDGTNGSQVPVVGEGKFASSQDPNKVARELGGGSSAGSKSGSLPPAPAKKGDSQPGLFGMLGSLLGGLFRTLGRVATALFKGVVGVGKALLS